MHNLATEVPGAVPRLDSGAVLIAPAAEMTEALAAEVAAEWHDAVFGMATVDSALPRRIAI